MYMNRKKLASRLLALLLALALTSVAMAATSANGVSAPAGYTIGEVTDPAAMEGVKDTAAAVETMRQLGIEDAEDYSLMSAFDLSGKAGDIRLSVPAAANCEVVLLHFADEAWEVAYEGVADANGSFGFHVDSLSPFALLVKGQVSSAKTADTTPVALLCGLGVLSLLGCVRVGKRAGA